MEKKFSAYLNDLIDKRGLSIRSVATSAGVSFSHLSRIIRDPSVPVPRIRFLDALPPVLNVPFSVFLFHAGQFLPEKKKESRQVENIERPKLTKEHLSSYLDEISRDQVMNLLFTGENIYNLDSVLKNLQVFFEKIQLDNELATKLIDSFKEIIMHVNPSMHKRRIRIEGALSKMEDEVQQKIKELESFKKRICTIITGHIGFVLNDDEQFDNLTTMNIMIYFSDFIKHDLDEILFMFDLIPSKFYSYDYSPNFATKLNRLNEWLDYVIRSFDEGFNSVFDQESTNTKTDASYAAFWAIYFNEEEWDEYWEKKEREKVSKKQMGDVSGNTPSGTKEFLPFDLKIANMGETTQISITLPTNVALSLLSELTALVKNVVTKKEKPAD